MVEMHEPTTTDVLRSLRLIRSPDPAERLRALQVLGTLRDDPRVRQVFEMLYEGDSDAGVRAAAWQVLNQSGPSIPAPGPDPEPQPAPVAVEPDHPPAAAESIPTASRDSLPARPFAMPGAFFLLDPTHVQRVKRAAWRRAQLKKRRGRWLFRLALALMLLVVVLVALVLPAWVTWYEYQQRGITLQGTISVREVRRGSYYLRYTFEVVEEGELVSYTGQQRVTAADYSVYREDMPVAVTYLHDTPTKSRLDVLNPVDRIHDKLTFASVGLLGVVLALLVLSLIQRYRPVPPLPRSPFIRGQVVVCTGRFDGDGDYKIVVQYCFRTPEGEIQVGQVRQLRDDLKDKALPAPGTSVVVEYQDSGAYRLL